MSTAKPMGFWAVVFGTVARPRATFMDLESDPDGPKKGVLALTLVIIVYSLIVGIFLIKSHAAMAPSILPIPLEDHYGYQIWYQGPLFFLSTLAASGVLALGAAAFGTRVRFPAAFSRLCFASAVPMAFTVMLVELTLSLLLLSGALSRQAILDWLSGQGAWFMVSYQAVSIAWIALLFLLAGIQTEGRKPWRGLALGGAALAVYALPVALFIR